MLFNNIVRVEMRTSAEMKSLEHELGLFSPFTAAKEPQTTIQHIYSPLVFTH